MAVGAIGKLLNTSLWDAAKWTGWRGAGVAGAVGGYATAQHALNIREGGIRSFYGDERYEGQYAQGLDATRGLVTAAALYGGLSSLVGRRMRNRAGDKVGPAMPLLLGLPAAGIVSGVRGIASGVRGAAGGIGAFGRGYGQAARAYGKWGQAQREVSSLERQYRARMAHPSTTTTAGMSIPGQVSPADIRAAEHSARSFGGHYTRATRGKGAEGFGRALHGRLRFKTLTKGVMGALQGVRKGSSTLAKNPLDTRVGQAFLNIPKTVGEFGAAWTASSRYRGAVRNVASLKAERVHQQREGVLGLGMEHTLGRRTIFAGDVAAAERSVLGFKGRRTRAYGTTGGNLYSAMRRSFRSASRIRRGVRAVNPGAHAAKNMAMRGARASHPANWNPKFTFAAGLGVIGAGAVAGHAQGSRSIQHKFPMLEARNVSMATPATRRLNYSTVGLTQALHNRRGRTF